MDTGYLGSNRAGSVSLLGAGPTNDRGMEITNDTDGVISQTHANDEPGTWGVLHAGVNTQFADDASGTGGGSFLGNDRIRRVFREETSGGPYIDSTDDITVGVSLARANTDSPISIEIVAQMAFVVFEYETRRAEFAPYDPGASMD
jgi:hypothetical protein